MKQKITSYGFFGFVFVLARQDVFYCSKACHSIPKISFKELSFQLLDFFFKKQM